MGPLVSILIPVYNRAALVAECIRSAQVQTYDNIEIVVCDNCSTDATWSVVQELAAADGRIRAFRNDSNVGPVRNWLRCVRESRGEYAKLLFSDDLIAPEFVRRTLTALADDPQVAFVFSAARLESFGAGGRGVLYQHETGKLSRDQYFRLLALPDVLPFSPCAALFRTADMRENLHDDIPSCRPREYWRHGAGPDVMLFALTALKYGSVAALSDPLVSFRAPADSITINNQSNQVTQGYRSAMSWFLRRHRGRAEWSRYLSRQWLIELSSKRCWAAPRKFCVEHEGSGSFSEAARLLAQGCAVGVVMLCHRVRRKTFA
jgi:glycosyltransferase involved in cell wall biosynthesis